MPEEAAKIGVPPFLNTKPLVASLKGFPVSEHPPSALLPLMKGGALDISLLPSADIFAAPGLTVLRDPCIASNGEVGSVALFSSKPPEKVASVALDSDSSSSAAMLKIILETFCGAKPRYETRKRGRDFFTGVDAGLVIGNAGLELRLSPPAGFPLVFDMGEEWTKQTGLPFVYAVFAAREGFDPAEAATALPAARDRGMRMLPEIAERESPALGIPANVCRDYLENKIKYGLGDEEIRGLLEFGRLLGKLRGTGGEPDITFYTPEKTR
ncbi:MAG: menaquinone biosynthesis protein [Candidatus Dadabacteria bacterium]|nr:menaquinone biosynthesis protein [Candidatus Dadabacteria bacterium]